MAKKIYAVARGRETGLFYNWSQVERLVKGFAGARYKSFGSEDEAREWLANPVASQPQRKTTASRGNAQGEAQPVASTAGQLLVYTDGGCLNNPGPGGYGVVILEKAGTRELAGGRRLTTNNRMEMLAAIIALEALADYPQPILLHSDSSYLVNAVNKGWLRQWQKRGWKKADGQPVLNRDLWERLLAAMNRVTVSYQWVRGHAGNVHNERCDQLAVGEARGRSLEVDEGYEATLGRGSGQLSLLA